MNSACITLPSSDAALALVRGDVMRGGLGSIGSTLVRAGLCAVGLYAVGERRQLVVKSLASALTIEAFVLAWVTWRKHASTSARAGGNA